MKIRILLFMVAAASLGRAQTPFAGMGMGMGGGANSSNPNLTYMRMFLGYGSGGMMGSGMGFGMTGDLAIGPDGTAYAMRVTPSASSSYPAWQYELDAISPANGSILWRLPIPGGRVSQPVIASDGLILVTVDNYQMFQPNLLMGTWMTNASQPQPAGGRLLVISHTATSASVAVTVQMSSEILSAPLLGADPSGGYLIYIVGYELMTAQTPPAPTFSPTQKTLYAYKSTGALRFSVNLSQ